MHPPVAEGYLVISKKGRDKGSIFVVLYEVDADFVLIVDGDRRKITKPKRKRRKHLSALPYETPEILALNAKGQLKDSDVRKSIALYKASLSS